MRASLTDGRSPRHADPLASRAQELISAAERRLEALRYERSSARFETMAQKAGLAEHLEAASIGAALTEDLVQRIREDWQQRPNLPAPFERLMAQRLSGASSATSETLARGVLVRAGILLDLEIGLGLPSPASESEARRERQLAQLKQHFAAATVEVWNPEAQVAFWYATPAAPDAEQQARLGVIIDHLARHPQDWPR
jgi:hypothetical protein